MALVVHFEGIDAEVLEAEAAAEWPVVAHEASSEALESLPLLHSDRRYCGVVLHESSVARLHLCDNDRVTLNRDDVGFESARVPVALDGQRAVSGEVAGGSSFAPRASFKLRD